MLMTVKTMETTNNPVRTAIEPLINFPFAEDFSSFGILFKLQFRAKFSTTKIVTNQVEDNILLTVFDLL